MVNAPESCYAPPQFTDTDSAGSLQPGEWRRVVSGDANLTPVNPAEMSRSCYSKAAFALRMDLMRFFLSPEGAVPWQADIVSRGTLGQ